MVTSPLPPTECRLLDTLVAPWSAPGPGLAAGNARRLRWGGGVLLLCAPRRRLRVGPGGGGGGARAELGEGGSKVLVSDALTAPSRRHQPIPKGCLRLMKISSWNQDKMGGVKYIRQRGTAFLNVLSPTFRLTNAKFSGSRRPGHSRPAPCSLSVSSRNLCHAAALNFITPAPNHLSGLPAKAAALPSNSFSI